MRSLTLTAAFLASLAGPAFADIDAALDRHVLPRMDVLAAGDADAGWRANATRPRCARPSPGPRRPGPGSRI